MTYGTARTAGKGKGFNRYIVECKSADTTEPFKITYRFNRYIVECK